MVAVLVLTVLLVVVLLVVCLVVLHGLLVIYNVPRTELGSENKQAQFLLATQTTFGDSYWPLSIRQHLVILTGHSALAGLRIRSFAHRLFAHSLISLKSNERL